MQMRMSSANQRYGFGLYDQCTAFGREYKKYDNEF